MDKLKELLDKKSIAIIGPAPTLVNKNLGNFIDKFDVIIRINEFVSQKLPEDYGSRTDVLFLSLNNQTVEINKKMFLENKDAGNNIKLIVCPRNSLHVSPFHEQNFVKDENIFNNFKLININNDFYHIGNEKNSNLEEIIGCHPTVGTLALALLNDIEIRSLFVGGFSMYTTKQTYNKAVYNLLKPFGVSNKNKSGHNTEVEIKFLQSIFTNKKNCHGDAYFRAVIQKRIKNKYFLRLSILYYNLLIKYFKNLERKF